MASGEHGGVKPVYSIDAPDQQRLKVARIEIEAVLKRHDVAGVIVLHTPGMAEFFYDIRPSYSVCWVDDVAQAVRVRSKKDADHGGSAERQLHDQSATANMVASLADSLRTAAGMFTHVQRVVDIALKAEHSAPTFVPDPRQARPS